MNNLFELPEGNRFEEMTMAELQAMSIRILTLQQKKLAENQKDLKNTIDQGLERTSNKIDQLEEKQEKQMQVAINSMRVNSPRYGWVNQGDFGRYLEPSIGAKTLGRLLRVVGLAQRSRTRVTPYRKYVGENGYARIKTFDRYTTTDWHYERCLEFIDDWLEDHGYSERFYATETEEERKKLIDELVDKYITGEGGY